MTGYVQSSNTSIGNPSLDVAVRRMNMIGNSIDEDLTNLEGEAGVDGLNDTAIAGLMSYCAMIQEAIDNKYVESVARIAELDPSGSSDAPKVMEENVRGFHSRLRQSMSSLRQAKSNGSRSGSSTPPSISPSMLSASSSSARSGTQAYKPFLERLKPPVFSGKIEDWPEFRSVWKDLLADYPESVQVQHMKANIPAADAKRVVGVKTMDEMWRRLEKVYGDKDLNIITVKTNLEKFVPKSNVDHKKILEVYEAIESAVRDSVG